MSDATVAEALRSTARLVVVEAPGGCGKTYQGATYARDIAPSLGEGRLLVLTHTNAACDVFTDRTRGLNRRIEIRTIDGLIIEIAGTYHQAFGLPADVGAWARREPNRYAILADRTVRLLTAHPIIAVCIARRYPVVICDEHQDASADQYAIIMSLYNAGSRLRIFANPMQMIFTGSAGEGAAAEQRWVNLKNAADRFEKLDTPHRWMNAQPALGAWIFSARATLRDGGQLDLRADLPAGLSVHYADNISPQRTGFRVAANLSQPIYTRANAQSLLILTGHNDRVTALRAFFNRRLPIWEGHVRDGLSGLVAHSKANEGNAGVLARGIVAFMGEIGSGFSPTAFGNRFVSEAEEGCAKARDGKLRLLQAMARHLVESPDHRGVAKALDHLRGLIETEVAFSGVRVDHTHEFAEAIQLGRYDDADEGFAEIARRRTHARPKLPAKAISTIHKAKGLEFDSVMLLPLRQREFWKHKGRKSEALCRHEQGDEQPDAGRLERSAKPAIQGELISRTRVSPGYTLMFAKIRVIIALLRATGQRPGQEVFNIQAVLKALERVDAMLSDNSHRAYAVWVLDGVQPFAAARRADLTSGERTALQFWLLKVAKSLASLQDDYKVRTESEATRARIGAVAATFVR